MCYWLSSAFITSTSFLNLFLVFISCLLTQDLQSNVVKPAAYNCISCLTCNLRVNIIFNIINKLIYFFQKVASKNEKMFCFIDTRKTNQRIFLFKFYIPKADWKFARTRCDYLLRKFIKTKFFQNFTH